jgi:Carboxypeptidase regulatory-like domain
MTRAQVSTIAIIALLTTLPAPALAGDVILSGTVTSAMGEKMGGVTVSAKAEGQTITTSVFTDEAGGYYFPPLTSGKYRVWAQALSYETAKSTIDLSAGKRQDFVLKPAKDFFSQLPGDVMLASLPGDTPDDFRMKTQVRKNCTGCHTASYPLQHKFDETGWNAILELMKRPLSRCGAQGHAQHRLPSEGARDLSRPRPRPGRKLDEGHAAGAAEGRDRARGVQGVRLSEGAGQRPAAALE